MRQEAIESATSYGAGFGTLALAYLTDLAKFSEQIAVILACIVVMVRAVHDSIRLYRYWKKK